MPMMIDRKAEFGDFGRVAKAAVGDDAGDAALHQPRHQDGASGCGAGIFTAVHHQDRAHRGWIQSVVATSMVFTHGSHSSSASAGVFQPSVFLGRALRAAATAVISSALWTLRSVPFGKY